MTSFDGVDPDTRRARLRILRGSAAVVAVVCFLTLAALALVADGGSAETAERAVTPGSGPGPAATPATAPSTEVVGPTMVAGVSEVATTPSPSPPAVTTQTPAEEQAPPPAPEPESPDVEPAEACALGIPPPERTGGLASLVPLVPAFGPFAAEAFAMAPAYEPIVELFGPFLPTFATVLEGHPEVADPIVAALRQLTTAGFDQLGPIYEPYRPQVLAAMADLGHALAPYSEQLAGSQAGVCLVALEGVVVTAAAG